MLRFIDISNNNAGLSLTGVRPSIDAVVMKATESNWFVDAYCDGWVQEAEALGLPWGFYHFAGSNDPVAEADFFISNTINYFGKGIPVLDWEGDQGVAWVNRFTGRVFERTAIHPWIYANPWRFNQGGVDPDCMRWVAQYPGITTYDQAMVSSPDPAEGTVGAWQFTSSGRLPGFVGNLDLDLFYGDANQWAAYAGRKAIQVEIPEKENAVYRLYNPATGDHFWTADHNEAVTLAQTGWVYEGIAWYVAKA